MTPAQFAFGKNHHYLQNISPIYYINLDSSPDRRVHMEKMGLECGLSLVRIPAVSGDSGLFIKSGINGGNTTFLGHPVSPSEYGCTCSHLRAIETAFEDLQVQDGYHDNNYILICEDDICLDNLPLWTQDLNHYLADLPTNWDCCLLYNSLGQTGIQPYGDHFGTCIYAVSYKGIHRAIHRIRSLFTDGVWDFSGEPDCAADILIYRLFDHVYVQGLFSCLNVDSTIHPDHLKGHRASSQALFNELLVKKVMSRK